MPSPSSPADDAEEHAVHGPERPTSPRTGTDRGHGGDVRTAPCGGESNRDADHERGEQARPADGTQDDPAELFGPRVAGPGVDAVDRQPRQVVVRNRP